MEQSNLFEIPDGAWASPYDRKDDVTFGAEDATREFGESPLNNCVVRAAELRHDFGQYQMERTIPSIFHPGSGPRWTVQSPGVKKNAVRMQYLSIYAYLALRAKTNPELQREADALRAIVGAGFEEFLRMAGFEATA